MTNDAITSCPYIHRLTSECHFRCSTAFRGLKRWGTFINHQSNAKTTRLLDYQLSLSSCRHPHFRTCGSLQSLRPLIPAQQMHRMANNQQSCKSRTFSTPEDVSSKFSGLISLHRCEKSAEILMTYTPVNNIITVQIPQA